MKLIDKILIFSLTLFFICQPIFVLADGYFISPLPGAFDFAEENAQQAFINYENGQEKLILAVSVKKESSEAVWILPVPANPREVKLNVVSALPNFYGEDIIKKAKKVDISALRDLVLLNQTLIAGIILVSFPGAGSSGGKLDIEQNLTVFQHLEKGGMVSEVISAQTEEALFDYLLNKGLKLELDALPVLNNYLSKNYTFIVSWIDRGAVKENGESEERGIFITFPTEKLFFPLILTSVYGEKIIPITLRVAGHIKPELYYVIKPFIETTYYTKARSYKKATQSRCVSALIQLRVVLESYRSDNGAYPLSLVDGEIEKVSSGTILMEEIKNRCLSFSYQVSSEGANYEATSFLGAGKEWMMNSDGFSGTREIISDSELDSFYGLDNSIAQGNIDYTKIAINSPSKNFTDDLWMKPGQPIKVWIAKVVLSWEKALQDGKTALISYFVFNAIVSFFVAGLLGLICFKKFKKYALVGLANLFSVIGLAIVFYAVQRRTYRVQPKPRPGTIGFVIVFSIILIVLSTILTEGFNLLI